MKYFIMLLLLCSYGAMLSAQDRLLQVNLKGKTFDSIQLVTWEKHRIEGILDDKKIWNFLIPDSVFEKAFNYHFFTKFEEDTETIYEISLASIFNNDTLRVVQMNFDPNSMYIEGVYSRSDTTGGIYFRYNNKVYKGSMAHDSFLVPYEENAEHIIQGRYPMFGAFYPEEEKNAETNKNILAEYVSFIEKHPDSRFLIRSVSSRMWYIKKKDYLQKLYNSFSAENRESLYGQQIREYLNSFPSYNEFSNSDLPNVQTNHPEPIIQYPDKYNLIVFSASWCGPCHKQIPLLKQIYNDLKSRVEITYITIDEEKSLPAWNALLAKESIPWRSLTAKDNPEEISKKYFAYAIPHTLLVYPGEIKMEAIDIRKKEDMDKLYRLK